MKTTKEKIEEFLNDKDWKILPIDKIEMTRALVLLLKEQDRDTRHACVEELLKLKRYGGSDEPLVILHEAEAACMNCKAV